MSIQVFIDGGEGTTGLRLRDRLGVRADITLLEIHADKRKDPAEKAKIANSADVVFLCLPDDAAREAVAGITNPAVRVLDASTAHRVAPDWDYGLPELSAQHRQGIETSKRVSVPGCYASGFNCLVYPLVNKGVLDPDYPVVAHAVSGYSGGGKKVIAQYQDPARPAWLVSPRQYALGQQHKHLPEMKQVSGLAHQPVFNPLICDYYAGMVVTVPVATRLLQGCGSLAQAHALFADHYEGQKMVTVMPLGAEAEEPGGMLAADAMADRDTMQIFVGGNDERIVLAARFDNLGKGASGAAIQCMNIMCGLDEATGLSL